MVLWVQVGPFWNISATRMEARQNIILSSPGPHTISVPYNLTLTGQGAFDTQQTWEWNSTASAPMTAGNQVRPSSRLYHALSGTDKAEESSEPWHVKPRLLSLETAFTAVLNLRKACEVASHMELLKHLSAG